MASKGRGVGPEEEQECMASGGWEASRVEGGDKGLRRKARDDRKEWPKADGGKA